MTTAHAATPRRHLEHRPERCLCDYRALGALGANLVRRLEVDHARTDVAGSRPLIDIEPTDRW